MPAAGSAYTAYDADVSTAGDSGHVEYLRAVVEQDEAAVKKIKAQIKGLQDALTAKQAELSNAKAALKAAGREG